MKTVNILDVEVSCFKRNELLEQIISWAEEGTRKTITYVNAHCLNLSARQSNYRELLNQTDLIYADGVSVVWASRLLGGCPLEKITGRDWIYDFCALASQKKLRIYILAGKPGVVQHANANLTQQFPDLKIVGWHNGYLDKDSRTHVLQSIKETNADVLFVGMGAPFQEQWIAKHREEISAPVCWGVGALFDYVAGQEPPVPGWLEYLALEWLWRLVVDPLGKWRRYLVGNPLFLYRLFRRLLTGK